MAACARVAGCEYDIAGQLAFNVNVELLNHAVFEIRFLSKQCPCKCR